MRDNPLIPLFVVSGIIWLNYSLFQIFAVIWITQGADVNHRLFNLNSDFIIFRKATFGLGAMRHLHCIIIIKKYIFAPL